MCVPEAIVLRYLLCGLLHYAMLCYALFIMIRVLCNVTNTAISFFPLLIIPLQILFDKTNTFAVLCVH